MGTMTAAARRREAAREYDVYMAHCPSRQLMDRLGDKWVGLILPALADGDLRYSELARVIAGVSQKMLTQTLRNLEADGLVTRTVTASVPVRVDYSLTPLGRSLVGVLAPLKDWAEQHMDQVIESRARFEAAQG